MKLEQIDTSNESFLDRLQREDKLDTFVNGVIFFISLIVFLAVLICVLCYFSRKKPNKRQMAFDAVVYTDLKEKTNMRITNIINEINKVKKGEVLVRQRTKVEDIPLDGEDSQSLANPAPSPPAKRSTRSRAPAKSQDNTMGGNESHS